MRRITTPIHHTYPQPAPRRAGLSTWSKFNEHRWSEFNAHEHGKGSFRVAGWVRNMFDEEYYVDTFGSFNTIHANRVAVYGDPRTWGVDVEYRF